MKASSFLSAGALAITLATLAAPGLAGAEDRPQQQDEGRRGNSHEFPGNGRGGRGAWNPGAGVSARAAQAPAQMPAARPSMEDRRDFRDMRARMEQNRQARPEQPATPVVRETQVRPWRSQDGDRRGTWSRDNTRDRDSSWSGRNPRDWNSGDRTRDPRWSDQRRDADRGGWRSDRDSYRDRDRNRDYRRDNRDWNRSAWRNDNRYDWRRYREAHRDTYRIGRYYAPYRSYSYRRIGIGFSLGALFYSNRYWIDDPWSYRLPAVYGPYRWVRYYDDVLLVNIYTGEVVDVIYDFFW